MLVDLSRTMNPDRVYTPHLQQAAQNPEDLDAQFFAAYLCEGGYCCVSVQNRAQNVLDWTKRGAEQGHCFSQALRGLMLCASTLSACDERKDAANEALGQALCEKALPQLLVLAEPLPPETALGDAASENDRMSKWRSTRGNPYALWLLGLMYMDGIGVERNDTLAGALLLRASEHAAAPAAHYALALWEATQDNGAEPDGQNVQVWNKESKVYENAGPSLMGAACYHHAGAEYLAGLLSTEADLPSDHFQCTRFWRQNLEKADRYLLYASQLGVTEAKYNRSLVLARMDKIEEAFSCMHDAAGAGHEGAGQALRQLYRQSGLSFTQKKATLAKIAAKASYDVGAVRRVGYLFATQKTPICPARTKLTL